MPEVISLATPKVSHGELLKAFRKELAALVKRIAFGKAQGQDNLAKALHSLILKVWYAKGLGLTDGGEAFRGFGVDVIQRMKGFHELCSLAEFAPSSPAIRNTVRKSLCKLLVDAGVESDHLEYVNRLNLDDAAK